MELLVIVAIWVCCGFACASIAEGKKRNTQTWFFLGILLGIFAVVAISILPALG